MVAVNPRILKWARETAGLSIEEACKKIGIKQTQKFSAEDRLQALESGIIEPSRAILIKMAKQYHRPLVVFYMSSPPRKGDRGEDFRTLPVGFSHQTNALVDTLMRDIQARQGIIRERLEDEEEVAPLKFVKSAKTNDEISTVVASITSTIKFDLIEYRRKATQEDAFSYLRSCVEAAGIFVLMIGDLGSHHTDISVEAFRGFTLADDIAPFIVINDQDSKSAWSFTLLHELTHLWLGQTGIGNTNYDRAIEKYCNDVASEILLPNMEIYQLNNIRGMKYKEIQEILSDYAIKRNISSSMVAYKVFRTGLIDKQTWEKLYNDYQLLWLENKKRQRVMHRKNKGGPNYYIVRRFVVGANLLSTVHRLVQGGGITSVQAGKVLGVKTKNVQKLLDYSTMGKINMM